MNAINLKKCVIKQFTDTFFVYDSISDQYKTKEICDKVVSLYPLLISCFSVKYKTQRMRDEAVDDSLAALKLILDGFVRSNMIKKLYTTWYGNDRLLFFDEDFLYCFVRR